MTKGSALSPAPNLEVPRICPLANPSFAIQHLEEGRLLSPMSPHTLRANRQGWLITRLHWVFSRSTWCHSHPCKRTPWRCRDRKQRLGWDNTPEGKEPLEGTSPNSISQPNPFCEPCLQTRLRGKTNAWCKGPPLPPLHSPACCCTVPKAQTCSYLLLSVFSSSWEHRKKQGDPQLPVEGHHVGIVCRPGGCKQAHIALHSTSWGQKPSTAVSHMGLGHPAAWCSQP